MRSEIELSKDSMFFLNSDFRNLIIIKIIKPVGIILIIRDNLLKDQNNSL